MTSKRMSLKKLAAHLSLSEGTVSRALNDYPDISQATRQRVQIAARELGYRPNPLARRLATGIAEAVAYIMPQSHSSISEPFVAQLLTGLGDALSKRGWDLLVTQSVPAEEEPDMIRKLVTSGRVSGVVLSRPHKNDARIKLLQEARFPFIVHGRSLNSDSYAWFDVDSKQAFVDAVDHLVSLGHRRIGFVGAPTYYNFAQSRLDGYRQALRMNGLPADEGLVRITELSDDGGERAAGDLLDQENAPTALLCVTDTQALGALAAVRSRGMQPGKHVSVIGYDGLRLGRHTNPPLTTMAQPQSHSGRELGDMLLAIIDGGDPRNFQQLRMAELLRRKSDGPVWTDGATQNNPTNFESVEELT
ncbi:MAG: LacI family DNA-binding transcriptional regulator [Ahrensia sp.]|nr:LacI family DNA-binding transcriptional regulator [Ahrensia sp.]